ncbi:hypothetical protein ACLSYN_01615 [Avibacterium avium]|uniref:hypothetical protein n=1 Tax=Avibacterium avium TaxID=751 RepID=UPI003BF7DBD9
MKKLTRFEYLQLAASLLPTEQLFDKNKSTDIEYDYLAEQLFKLAEAIELRYEARYRYTTEDDFALRIE